MGYDDPVPGISLDAFNAAIREKPCPRCGIVGGLTLAWRFRTVPHGLAYVAGNQPKVSARRLLIGTCAECGIEAIVEPVKMSRPGSEADAAT